MEYIRPIAICLFRQDDSILVFEGYDPYRDEVFYRPLGGGINFGEHSRDALIREIREEIGAEITNITYLAALENIFTHKANPGHEIVMLYDAEFVDPSFYEQFQLTGVEDDGTPFEVLWKPISDFQQDILYPTGLLELLQADSSTPLPHR